MAETTNASTAPTTPASPTSPASTGASSTDTSSMQQGGAQTPSASTGQTSTSSHQGTPSSDSHGGSSGSGSDGSGSGNANGMADTAGATTQNQGDGTFEKTKPVDLLTWGPIKLSVSEEKGVMGLNNGFSTSLKLNTETNDDKAGKPKVNTQTLELQQVSFDYSLNAYFLKGTTIEKEYSNWEKNIAKHHPLYLNGKQFGPKELQLVEVQLSDSRIDDWGRFLYAKISITLQEYAPEKSKSKKTANTKSKSSKKSKGRASYSSTKKSAKSVGPSKSAKAAKKR